MELLLLGLSFMRMNTVLKVRKAFKIILTLKFPFNISVIVQHFRDGKEIEPINRDDFYNSSLQEIRHLRTRPKLLPDDVLKFTCFYDTRKRNGVKVKLVDVMCSGHIYYYPAIAFDSCKSWLNDEMLYNAVKYMEQ